MVVSCATYSAMTSLSDLLKNRGLKLIDLARKLEVDKATVTRWNRKGVPSDRLTKVQEKTGIAPEDLRPDLASIFSKDEDAA